MEQLNVNKAKGGGGPNNHPFGFSRKKPTRERTCVADRPITPVPMRTRDEYSAAALFSAWLDSGCHLRVRRGARLRHLRCLGTRREPPSQRIPRRSQGTCGEVPHVNYLNSICELADEFGESPCSPNSALAKSEASRRADLGEDGDCRAQSKTTLRKNSSPPQQLGLQVAELAKSFAREGRCRTGGPKASAASATTRIRILRCDRRLVARDDLERTSCISFPGWSQGTSGETTGWKPIPRGCCA